MLSTRRSETYSGSHSRFKRPLPWRNRPRAGAVGDVMSVSGEMCIRTNENLEAGFSVPANPGFAGCAQVTLETERGDRGDALGGVKGGESVYFGLTGIFGRLG